MAKSDRTAQFRKPPRGCLSCLTTAVVFGILTPFGFRCLHEHSRVASEREELKRRQEVLNDVKGGRRTVIVSDARLLPMLADDPACVANLAEMTFSMVNITAEDAEQVSRLINVRSMVFYDTRGADYVLEHARHLPIERLFFEKARLSSDALSRLSQFRRLKTVHFEYDVYPDEIAILQSLPPDITVETPHRSEVRPSR
jgi:hypothetical protein